LNALEYRADLAEVSLPGLRAEVIGPCLLRRGDRDQGTSSTRGRPEQLGALVVRIVLEDSEPVRYEEIRDSLHALPRHSKTSSDLGDAGRSVLGGVEDDPARKCLAAERRDHMLTNVMLYWLTATAGSAARLYYENMHMPPAWGQPPAITPTGVAAFAEDIAIRRYGEQANNIVHWSDIDQGGHFAAMEAPELLVSDVRTFFRGLR
jgi:pimeloyl-ACP methyl ester carboxylesterase